MCDFKESSLPGVAAEPDLMKHSFCSSFIFQKPPVDLVTRTWSWVYVYELYRHSLITQKWAVFMEDWEKFSFQWFKNISVNDLNPCHCKWNYILKNLSVSRHSILDRKFVSQLRKFVSANTMDSWSKQIWGLQLKASPWEGLDVRSLDKGQMTLLWQFVSHHLSAVSTFKKCVEVPPFLLLLKSKPPHVNPSLPSVCSRWSGILGTIQTHLYF